ncbi:hypothetical protein [Nesterenkonia sp. HG001]|uniref:hypothetical protein n=1 Tax=Nesterenkonia sp. HG001 TaxID=2983207 RepID=UPI002AC4E0F0|nr:hypothetical protein [Nesterenkonia sp. HG001]MDZ5077750.1 hypothetical protein [Nesterenkonia sp. HG001]
MNTPELSITINGIALSAPRVPRQKEVLTAEALSFLARLHEEFGARATALGVREDGAGADLIIEASWRALITKQLAEPASSIVRPRCLGRREGRMFYRGEALSAGLVDFGIHVHHSARRLLAEGRAPFVELPSFEQEEEVALWQEIFSRAEQLLEIPDGTIRAIHLNPRAAAEARSARTAGTTGGRRLTGAAA